MEFEANATSPSSAKLADTSSAKLAELSSTELAALMQTLGRTALAAATQLAQAPPTSKRAALQGMAAAIREQASSILAANHQDLQQARQRNLSAALLDRLSLDP